MPRRTLVRARDLRAFRRALVHLCLDGTPLDAARRVVVVPTLAAGALLRETVESHVRARGGEAVVLPSFVTRDGLMTRLHAALPGAAPLATPLERHVLLGRAAVDAAARPRVGRPPFAVRPGLVTAMLDLYDELRRRHRTVRRFARVLFDQLRGEIEDRGSRSLIQQTTFLGFTWLAYERRLAAAGRLDEHALRRLLIQLQPTLPFDHVVVAVADHPADPRGLWPADFDLIGRLAHLPRLDVVATDETHDAGLRGRLEAELPGILEVRQDVEPAPPPLFLRPAAVDGAARPVAAVSRDRVEELRDVARAIRARAEGGVLRDRCAVVFHRPLPYVHLAPQVFADAGLPFQALDALPLASEPYAALVDLVLAVARTGGARDATVALLRSALVVFEQGGAPVRLADVGALESVLAERRTAGGAATFPGEVEAYFGDRSTRHGLDRQAARRAAGAADDVRRTLAALADEDRASAQVRSLVSFLRAHESRGEGGLDSADAVAIGRGARARAAVLATLEGLAAAFERHDDRVRSQDELLTAVRHAIESRTFLPVSPRAGVYLADAMAARFGQFDHVHVVGLVETDWPERPRRSVFYTTGLLTALSWPAETDQAAAQHAAFRDLLGLAARTTSLHAFELEGDAVVAPSPLLELVRGVSFEDAPALPRLVFPDETLTRDALPVGLAPDVAAWLALRRARPSLSLGRYAGRVGPRSPQPYRVSRVDRYVDCPFKYFAESVLGLPEERRDMAGLTPLERGTLLHEIFERFYRAWADRGEGTITAATLPAALALFADVAAEALARLPEADRALEHTRLLGSIVARGVAERVFELEVDAGGRIVDRLLETDLHGEFVFPLLGGLKQKTVAIRGKADRIDVFHDGSLRVVDYKLGRLPDVKSSVQIGVYAHCASQALEARDGRPHPVVAAMYLAFGDDRRLEGRLGRSDVPAALDVADAAGRFAGQTDLIESGAFPPKPRRPGECAWCGYAGVCRKEYVADGDDTAAEPV